MSPIKVEESIKQKYAESLLVGLTLAFCGGYIDAYTYVLREHSLVAGQTGNIVFLAVDIVSKGFVLTETRLFTLIFFVLGIFTISFIAEKFKSPYVKPLSLIPCILACLVIGFLPVSTPDYLVVPPLAFGVGIQTTSFSKIEGIPYNNSFLTGNVKKGMIAWNGFFFSHSLDEKHAALLYFEITFSFALGALVSASLQKVCGIKTIWLIVLILSVIVWRYLYLLRQQKNNGPQK